MDGRWLCLGNQLKELLESFFFLLEFFFPFQFLAIRNDVDFMM
jgi:hypothetical protein